MTEQELLQLVMNRSKTNTYEGDLCDLLLAYVRRLAQLSDQLDQKAFTQLADIAVGMYQLALIEFEAGIDAQELLEVLQKKSQRK